MVMKTSTKKNGTRTQTKRTRDADSEELSFFYQRLVALSPNGIIVIVAEHFVFANQKAAEICGGASPVNIVGRPMWDFIPGDQREKFQERLRSVLEDGQDAPTIQTSLLRLDGSLVDVDASTAEVIFRGQPAALVMLQDVTARAEMQRDLQGSEERYRQLYENAPLGAYTVNNKGIILRTNPAFQALLGFSQDELHGMPSRDRYPEGPDGLDLLMSIRKNTTPGEPDPVVDIKMLRSDGQEIWVRRTIRSVINLDGEHEGFGTVIDITHEREMEDALRGSEERYRRMFDTSPVAHIATKSGFITNANPTATEMLGYSQEELIGMPSENLFPDREDSRKRRAENHALFEKGIPEWDNEQRMVRKDGREIIVRHKGHLSVDHNEERVALGTFIDITQQKEAEEALRESEERYRRMFDNSPVAHIATQSGYITDANPMATEMLGYSLEELIGMPVENLAPDKEDARKMRAENHVRFEHEIPEWDNEPRMVCKDGREIIVRHKGQLSLDHEGKRVGLGTFIDITRQKEAEEALRESEEHYHAIYDHLNEAIVQVGEHGEILEANRAFGRLLGYTAEELASISFFDLVPAERREKMPDQWQKFATTKESKIDRRDLVAKDGSLRPVENWAGRLKGRNGTPDSVLTVFRDLRKQLADQDALSRSEERYRAIYDGLTDGVVQYDLDTNIVGANPAYERLLGYELDELLTMTRDDVVPHDGLQSINEVHQRLLAGETIPPQARLLRHKNGDRIPAESVPYLLLDRIGDPEGILVVCRDLRKQQQSQRVDHELAIMEERTRFAREIHDTVAQTLTALVIQLDATEETLLRDPEASKQQLDLSQELARACLTQTRSALLDLKPSELEPGGLVDGINAEALGFQRRGLDVRVNVQGIEPTNSDEQAALSIFRIVQEALSNAFDHGKAKLVTVDLVFGPDDAVLHIVDDGEGFDVKGQRAKGQQGGRGFGLGIMEERADIVGGELTVISATGTGTRIIGRIPYSPSGPSYATIANQPMKSEPITPTEELDEVCTVLLVDDHELVRHGIKAWLETTPDIDVIGEADTGESAVAKAQDIRPDIILMDIHMPTMNGIEATKQIVDLLPEAKVILLSVYDDHDHLREGLRAGAMGYMVKGASRQEVLNGIRTVFAGGSLVPSASIANLANPPETPSGLKVSPREKEIWRLLADGASTLEISSSLIVSQNTVNFHLRNLYQKLGVKSRTQAVKAGQRLGLLELVS